MLTHFFPITKAGGVDTELDRIMVLKTAQRKSHFTVL